MSVKVHVFKAQLYSFIIIPFVFYVYAENSLPVSLEDILIFFTGADREPPLGFPVIPRLKFLHGEQHTLATASTCSLILRLPTVHKSYASFKQYMALSFGGHGGFGVV